MYIIVVDVNIRLEKSAKKQTANARNAVTQGQ